jgi:hypothetical protein
LYIQQNQHIAKLDPETVSWAFYPEEFRANNHRPLTWLSHAARAGRRRRTPLYIIPKSLALPTPAMIGLDSPLTIHAAKCFSPRQVGIELKI